MHLSGVQIDRFRGLRRCSLQLAPTTTTLIGENNCGKSSILDAIGLLLSPSWLRDAGADDDAGGREAGSPPKPPLGPLDFHLDVNEPEPGPLRIHVSFAELAPDEWPEALLARLGAAVWSDRSGLRHLNLRGEAHPPDASGAVRRTVTALGGDVQPLDVDAAALHAEICRIKPIVRLRSDRTLARAPLDAFNHGADAVDPRHRPDLGARLAGLHDALVDPDGGWPDLSKELKGLGELLALDPDEVAAVGGSSDRLIEILRQRSGRLSVAGGAALPLSRQGVGTQALVLVLLLGALLAGGARGLDPLADPLVVLEDPEAHLHPRTLAFLARGVAALRAQKLVVTHSGDLLGAMPMTSIRRLHRRGEDVRVFQLGETTLSADEVRKVDYHIRSRRRTVLFARCWLLVEGETEFWLLPAMAQRLGVDLLFESVACVEFAQCGLTPLIKTADDFGIQWHLLADGDEAGSHYAEAAADWLRDEPAARRVTKLGHRDIETSLWHHGYAQVYRDAAGLVGRRPRPGERPADIIGRAIRGASKPNLAQRVIEAASLDGSPGTPPAIERAIRTAVELARAEGIGRRPARRPTVRSRS